MKIKIKRKKNIIINFKKNLKRIQLKIEIQMIPEIQKINLYLNNNKITSSTDKSDLLLFLKVRK
jgi:hypothetical protein